MLELIKEINGRDLLNTLTDAGLIPTTRSRSRASS
jgi:DEAD/DEAH box helicase domain-containing protein